MEVDLIYLDLFYKQYLAYISNRGSTLTMLDFSNNQEVQETIQRRDFFTANASERIYIDMRNSLGYTGKKDPMKRDGSSINVETSLRDAVEYDLDVTDVRQGFTEFVYESRKDGNMIQMYEYKVVKDEKSKKLDDIRHRESPSRKRKLGGVDQKLLRAI